MTDRTAKQTKAEAKRVRMAAAELKVRAKLGALADVIIGPWQPECQTAAERAERRSRMVAGGRVDRQTHGRW